MEEKQVKRRFDKAFKVAAVKMVKDGQSKAEVARSLGIHENLLYSWEKKLSAEGDKAFVGQGNLTELVRLQRENESLKLDNEVLKKAIGIFSEKAKKSTSL
jgi:transposase